ncbi:hsp90 co-chaperone Cdc37 [Dimargaris cristalligena]|nr:hsp90 co-chaperone Cdc37 [Dimargaris cristalligena]
MARPLNYSKWDNIELSDDDEVEVHPNVDKQSFIRWRQQAIHRERQERDFKIENLNHQIAYQTELLGEIAKLQDMLKQKDAPTFLALVQKLQAHAEARQKAQADQEKATAKAVDEEGAATPAPSSSSDQGPLSIEDMMAGLIMNIQGQLTPEIIQSGRVLGTYEQLLAEHHQRLADQVSKARAELEKQEREKRNKLSTNALCRPGFDKSSVNKGATPVPIIRPSETQEEEEEEEKKEEAPSSKAASAAPSTSTKSKTTTQTIEVLNSDRLAEQQTKATAPAKPSTPGLTIEQIVEEFTALKDMPSTVGYISKHPNIVDESISDEILVKAFEAQMKGDTAVAQRAVHQALLLQYCARLGRDGVSLFFMRYRQDPRAQAMFQAEVRSMHQRIVERSRVLLEQRRNQTPAAEDIESIQLQCDDPDAPIEIQIPDLAADIPLDQLTPEDRHVRELYESLPDHFQAALQTGKLEKVNESFAKMPGAEAERVLQACTEGGFISIAGEMIVDPDEKENAK